MLKHIRVIAIFLLFILFFTLLPTPTLAKEIINSIHQQELLNVPPVEKIEKKDAKIIQEAVEKREKNVKHFLKEDNTYEASVYSTAVHYKSEGIWKDINNSLIDSFDEEMNGVIENKDNGYKIKMAKNTQSNKLVKIKKGTYEISWNMDNIQKSTSQIQPIDVKDETSLTENEKKKTLKNLTSIVNFPDVLPETDLQYVVNPEEVKENIIIKNKVDNPQYTFNISVSNLTAKLQDDKSIIFFDSVDSKNEIFKIKTPFMYDAQNNESADIEVSLVQNSNGYTLTLTPSNEWINSSERVFPITIDPPITTSLTGDSIFDAHITESLPTSNFANSYILKTGTGRHRTYVKFNLPTLSSGDMIFAAYFKATLYSSNPDFRQVDIHKVNTSWEESTITWANTPANSYDTKIVDFQQVKDALQQYAWDITSIVKDWYSTGINNGVMLKNNNESIGYCEFISSETSGTYMSARPQVTIYYTNNSGLENYWTYHSQSVGRSGTGYVNDYNGNLVFIHDDLTMNGNRMPVSVSHVYNSNDKDTDIYYGKGWRLNLSQNLKYQNIGGVEYYIYTDGDGTKHYMKSAGGGKYTDESGLGLTLVANPSGTYTITDKKDNVYNFATFAKLRSVYDSNGNAMVLNYDAKYNLISVVDGAGRTTTLDITSAGHLLGITDPSGRRTSFGYNGVQLVKITYPDGKYSQFDYDTSNKLTTVLNHDNYKMIYSYTPGQPSRITKVSEYGTDGTLGQTLDLSYGYNTTTFTDKSNRKNIYQFNTLGHTTSIRDNEGNAEYYKYYEGDNSAKNKLKSTSRLQKTVMNYLKNHNIEGTGDWTYDNWKDSTAILGIAESEAADPTAKSYLGKHSLMVNKTNDITRHFYQQILYLEKGKTYTFSGYIRTDENGISKNNEKGAALFVNYTDSANNWVTVDSNYVNGVKGWDRYEVTFAIPTDATSTMVYLRAGVVEETGTAYFDSL